MRKRIKKQKSGYTLIELVITFALTAIFILCSTMMLNMSTSMYKKVAERENASTLTTLLLDKIKGEISAASDRSFTIAENNPKKDTQIDTGEGVDFYDRYGSHLYITTGDDGHLLMHYYSLANGYSAIDWTFNNSIYNGYVIDELKFEKIEDKPIIHITMVVKNGNYTYETESFAECYNIEDQRNITNGIIAYE